MAHMHDIISSRGHGSPNFSARMDDQPALFSAHHVKLLHLVTASFSVQNAHADEIFFVTTLGWAKVIKGLSLLHTSFDTGEFYVRFLPTEDHATAGCLEQWRFECS